MFKYIYLIHNKKKFNLKKYHHSYIATLPVGSTKIRSSSRYVSCALSLSSSKIVTPVKSTNEESREISRSEGSRFLQLVHLHPGPQYEGFFYYIDTFVGTAPSTATSLGLPFHSCFYICKRNKFRLVQ